MKKNKHKINEQITSYEVRLIGENSSKIVKTSVAIQMAYNEEKDLILLNENQNPPIAKIEDYRKFLYEEEKADKLRKKNSTKSTLKEIQLSVEIADNDLKTKARKAIELLKHGDKIKCSLLLKGRQKMTPERGELTMLKFASLLENDGLIEDMPKLQGGKWIIMVNPKKK